MGRQLRAMFIKAGLVQVEVRGVVAFLTSFPMADQIMELTRSAREAVDDNRVPASRAAQWLDELRDSDGDGTFLASVNAYIVVRRKP